MNTHSLYAFLTGPGFIIALSFFLLGTTGRLFAFFWEARKKDRAFFAFFSPWYAGRSLFFHTLPFASHVSREHGFTTVATTLFHISLFVLTLFHSGHVVLIADALGPYASFWPMLGESASHILAWTCAGALFFLMGRRVVMPTIRYLTLPRDHFLNAAIFLLIASGIWSRMQLPGFFIAGLIHMASGLILIAITPFTRLSHLFFIPLTRGYAGSEFGSVRHARDW